MTYPRAMKLLKQRSHRCINNTKKQTFPKVHYREHLLLILSEKCAFAAFTVVFYKLFNVVSGAAEIFRKTVYAEKFICVPEYQLAVNGDIVRQQGSAAFFAGVVVCH